MADFLFVSALSLGLLLAPSAHAVQSCSKQSPAHTVALLELYTSEGCDSCPPADRFVSGLRASGLGAEQVVPLSLHVDYWDYIGWKDVFAHHAYTERQRWLSALANSRTVYTPEFFIGGREQRDWRGGVPSAVRRVNQRPALAQIAITIGQPSGGALPVEISARAARDGNLFVALYQNGLSSEVKAGENRGAMLTHDYVVRDWIGPLTLTADGRTALPRALALPAGALPKNLGVAAFVQTDRGEVLQALALPLCG